jgi:hypothetical protein
MRTSIVCLLAVVFLTQACSFKKSDSTTSQAVQALNAAIPAPSPTPKQPPTNLLISQDGKQYALIDYVNFTNDAYAIDQTIAVNGEMDFPYQDPSFTPHQCSGIGYDVTYTPKIKTMTQNLKLLFFKNGQRVYEDHSLIATQDSISVAIYAEYGPISEFYEEGLLPNEYTNSLQPSNNCHVMCTQARVTPLRPLINVPNMSMCEYTIWGYDGHNPTTTATTDFWFQPREFFDPNITNQQGYINLWSQCGAIQNNDDLKNAYAQAIALASGTCTNNSGATMMDEYFFVEQKIQYQAPTYTITNFSNILKDTTNSQSAGRNGFPAHKRSDW